MMNRGHRHQKSIHKEPKMKKVVTWGLLACWPLLLSTPAASHQQGAADEKVIQAAVELAPRAPSPATGGSQMCGKQPCDADNKKPSSLSMSLIGLMVLVFMAGRRLD
jgi:hypothetical protein